MIRTITCAFVLTLVSQPALAHFPWLAVDAEGKAAFFFGETPAERSYKLPAPIAKAKVMTVNKEGKVQEITLNRVENDDFIGMVSQNTVSGAKALLAKVTYGMYAGSRLDYYAMHQAGPLPTDRKAYEGKKNAKLDLQTQLVDTDKGVDVYVLWKGKPLAKADVTLFCDDGHEEGAATTDESGKVSFNDREVEDGLNGIRVGHKLEKDSGKWNGEEYTSSSHYLTVTFHDPEDFEERK